MTPAWRLGSEFDDGGEDGHGNGDHAAEPDGEPERLVLKR